MKKLLSLLSFGALIAASAPASLTFAEIAQWSYYTQSSDAAPSAAVDHAFSARIFSNTVGEVGSATVTAPDSSVYNLTAGATISSYFDSGFATMGDVSAQYGAGVYAFKMTSGPLSGAMDAVNYPGVTTFSANPYINNFTAVTSAPIEDARTFSWSTSYTASGVFTGRQNYFVLRDLTANTVLINTQGNASSFGSVNLAANSLIAGHLYEYRLTFGALNQVQSQAGFGPAFMTGTTYAQTIGRFEAVPEPGTMAALALGGLVMARKRRK